MPDTNQTTCPDCGTTYPANDFGGMCPGCLLLGLGEESEDGTPRLPDLAGIRIDRYLLIEQIGEGGMGTVWRARQDEPVEREVALKLIKPGMDTRSVLARFDAERQVLANLDHPHIAQIFDAGATDSGRPYYVMELVDGLPVTEYCVQHKLSSDDRLALFNQICKAIQHAHDQGVVHRDLKPSNILVTDHVEVRLKVIDFGVAKAAGSAFAEETLMTHAGQIIGTPGYMSPEQADGLADIDGRADVYSLGALLYEMLSGTPPFTQESLRNAGLLEVIRIIKEDQPPKPSTRLNATAGQAVSPVLKIADDLDWIALKALAKDPAQRYQSPADLVQDIARHLKRDPVSASAPSFPRRADRWLRRHRGACTTALIAALAVGAALVLSKLAKDPTDPTPGGEVVVDTLLDEDDGQLGGGSGISLREAIAYGSRPMILFDPDLSGETITLAKGQLLIDRDLTLDASTLPERLAIDGAGKHRVFEIAKDAKVTMDSLKITGGATLAKGGGILNHSVAGLKLTNCIVTGNSAANDGGGIHNNLGTMQVSRTTISANTTAEHGGGVYNNGGSGSATFIIADSAILGNKASTRGGGGIVNANGVLTMQRCTVSLNEANGSAGVNTVAWYGRAKTTLRQVTITANSSTISGGGISIGSKGGKATVEIENSIVANNTAPEAPDIGMGTGDVLVPTGVNLISDLAGSGLEAGASLLVGDAKLAPLGDYGEPVATMPPLPGSPAIDATATAGGIDGDGDGDPKFDLGAVEFDPAQ